MESTARIYVSDDDVRSRLESLGLTWSVMEGAIKFALQYALDCTEHDPHGAPGSMMYHKGNRGLRDRLVPQGWRVDQNQNFETTVHPEDTHAISVTAGNRDTGDSHKSPSTKRDRGPATRGAVETNQQLSLFDLLGEDSTLRVLRPLLAPRRHTWLLLHFIDWRAEEVRYELSLPLEMTPEGYVQEWQERVIFGPIPFTRDPLHSDDGPDEPNIDFDVPRRTG